MGKLYVILNSLDKVQHVGIHERSDDAWSIGLGWPSVAEVAKRQREGWKCREARLVYASRASPESPTSSIRPFSTRELLELSARSIGLKKDDSPFNGGGYGNDGFDVLGRLMLDWHNNIAWDPINNTADCGRLEGHHQLNVVWHPNSVCVGDVVVSFDTHGGDAQAARRFATTYCAANIGEKL